MLIRRFELVSDSALWRLIAFTRVHHVLLFLSFLVHNIQRTPVRRHPLYFHLVKAAVLRAVSRSIGKAVLVAQHGRHLLEDAGNFAIELRKPGKSSRLSGKSF